MHPREARTTRILTAEGQRLVSEGPPVNIPSQIAIPYLDWEGGVHDGQLPTFDAESKSVKIQKSLYGGVGGP